MANNKMNPVETKGVHSISNIAKWFLSKESMSHRKLQKLCYYAEAWFIVFKNQKLYNDAYFEGWVHGPVAPNLYFDYKEIGYFDIPKYKGEVLVEDEVQKHLEFVYEIYKDLDGYQLSDISHKEEPWLESREGLGEFERGRKHLNLETIRSFYQGIIEELSV